MCGTVHSSEKDGSMPVDGSNRNYRARHKMQSSRRLAVSRSMMDMGSSMSSEPMNLQTVFAGTSGALATAPGKCNLQPETLADLIDHGMSLDKLSDLAFMFNFNEDGLGAGKEMLSVQLYDGTGQSKYMSDWSRGFGLESVGFSQVLG